MENLLSISETAKVLNISVSSLYRLTSQRKIPFIKIGSRVIFQPEKIDAWLEKRAVKMEGVEQ